MSAKLQLTILLGAVPDPDFAPSSHRGSVVILPREFLVGSLARAVESYAVFLLDNQLGPTNLVGAGLVRCEGEPICRVAPDGKLLAVDAEGRATGLQYRDPTAPKIQFRTLGAAVRYLREDARLLRKDLAAGAGVATETVRNLETERHAPTVWTWGRLLGHPALADLPRLARESGLELPKGAVAGELRNPQLHGTRGTTAPVRGRGDGGDGGDDGEGDEGGGSEGAPDRGTR